MKAVLCADIGTSSLKAAVISFSGIVLGRSRQAFLRYYTETSAKEWFFSLKCAILDIQAQLEAKSQKLELCALCISGNGPTICAPTGETLLWNHSAPQNSYQGDSLFIPRILSFKDKFKEVWKKSDIIFSGPEFLIWQLTGNALSILPEKRYTNAYWSLDSLKSSGLSDEEAKKLPDFVSPASKAGNLTENAAKDLALLSGLPVFCGAPDFISALVGTNTLSVGSLCDRAGSSEGLNLCTKEPLNAEGIRTLPSVIPDLWNASVLLPASGTQFEAFRKKIERECGREISFKELVDSCVTSDGSKASLDQGKYLMLQTALQVRDGIFLLKKNINAQREAGFVPDSMMITGGQAQNSSWNQMKSTITGLKIKVPECSDAELIGDAVFALLGLGVFDSIKKGADSLCRISEIFEPQE